ncbi:hypothetical protein CTI12_AA468260 [Artemisia annua]|uniref:TF-B3 domain-containing protein n=1 Tax=Artemisia annua TaxID=35608 RepID=A0A2U1LNR8_ARTAN|nr:hypothetical protein CTI12_AA468260 [Artemisia annua]
MTGLLPGDFIQDIWQPSFKLIYSTDMIFYVKNERVKPYPDRPVRMNTFIGDGWDDFIETTGIESGQRLAFTNMERYTLSVAVIGGDGLGLSKEDIRFQLPKKPPRPTFLRDRNDLRFQHLCRWAHHADHENEDHVLYTRFTGDELKLVYDFDETEQLRKCTRAKLVHRNVMGNGFQMRAEIVIEHDSIKKKELLILKGNWHQFGKDCAFEENSMLRFKLVRIDKRYVGGADDGVPEENKRLITMEKAAISSQVVHGSLNDDAVSKQLETIKEEMRFIKSKVQFYDKLFFLISVLVVLISFVIAVSIMQ